MPIIWGTGHSHAWALNRAAMSPGFAPQGFSVRLPVLGSKSFPGGVVLSDERGQPIINPVLDRALPKPDDDNVPVFFSALFGNGHFGLCLAEQAPSIDIIVPPYPKLPERRRIVPRDLAVELFKKNDMQLSVLFTLLRAKGYSTIVQIAAPPPPEEHSSQFLEFVRSKGGMPVPPLLTLKAYICQEIALRELCQSLGAVYCPAPERALTSTGFLRQELSSPDGIHATTEYGSMALTQAISLCNRKEA